MTVFLSTGAVAKQLGVTAQTVRDLIKAGKLPALLVGTKYKIREEDLMAFVRKNWVGPWPPGVFGTTDGSVR